MIIFFTAKVKDIFNKNNNIQIDDESTSYQGGKLWTSKKEKSL
jgi:hypothetical protein